MKHVFVIGSHTPYLSTLAIIDKLQLKKQDIVFVLGRNYKCFVQDKEIETYDISPIYYIYLKGRTRKQVRAQIAEISAFIDKTITEPYTLYIPHLAFFTFQIFATHKNCVDIKFMQEAIADFCREEGRWQMPTLRKIFVDLYFFLGTKVWQSQGWNSYDKLKGKKVSETFAITDKIFMPMHCKHTIIKWPEIKVNLNLDPKASYFVLESLVEQKNIEKQIFMDGCSKLFAKYGAEHNYIKFHPYQKEENKQEILGLFKKLGMHIEVLPNDVPFEMILCSMKNMRVCGFTTSLIFYASLMGHEAHICAPAFYKSQKFMNYWNSYSSGLRRYGDVFKYEEL